MEKKEFIKFLKKLSETAIKDKESFDDKEIKMFYHARAETYKQCAEWLEDVYCQ